MEKNQQNKQQQQQQPADGAADSGSNAQRIPIRMLNGRKGNTEVRDGKCYIMYRSQMDPRWPTPQFIDESAADRNRLESLNLQLLNPDLTVRRHIKCICTRLINLVDDWYALLHDGTVLCNSCARCFRCFTICFTAGRKLNSIDGFLLCNTCMLSYGCYREPRSRIRLQPMPRLPGELGEPDGKAAGAAAANNGNSDGQTLEKPRFRDEGRRPLRLIYYPNPRPENYGRPDYRFEAPPYLAVDRNCGSQTCPQCGHQALAQALVVPGYARVYHERSFRCESCKRPMHAGYQTPGVQFESCSCHPPRLWCTGYLCRTARMAHHADKSCHLAPVHPGGRPKRDVPGFLPRYDPAVTAAAQAKFVDQHETEWEKSKKKQQQQEQQQEQQEQQQQQQ